MPLQEADASLIALLYVDDEPDILTIGKRFLEKKGGFTVHTSENVNDAITLLSERRFDAIISDYQMPVCDGIRFMQYLRERGDETPFIIFTGKGDEEVVIRALNSGVDFYLQKEGDLRKQFAELENAIRYAVAQKRSEKALRESENRYRSLFDSMHDGYVHHQVIRNQGAKTIRYPIIEANKAFEEISGLSRDQILGKEMKEILSELEAAWDERFERAAFMHETQVFDYPHPDLERHFEVSIYSPGSTECSTLFHDITEKKKREEETKRSLRDKEILLKEIHHRVKNNMQVVSSLLMLQKENILDTTVRDLLSESQNRVYSIALVHEKLYHSGNLSRINYGEYLHNMTDYVLASQGMGEGTVSIEISAPDIFLTIETAVPLSLITNELLTNALKHAFFGWQNRIDCHNP